MAFGKHETLVGIEAAEDGRKAGFAAGDLEDARKTEKVEGGTACFKYQPVRRYNERGFAVGEY